MTKKLIILCLITLFCETAWAGQCTERKWREDYPRNGEAGLICKNLKSDKLFYIFSKNRDCAFELYYRNGRVLAQSYVVTRYIDKLDFSGLRLDRESLRLAKGSKTFATCKVSNAKIIINEYNDNVLSLLEKNMF